MHGRRTHLVGEAAQPLLGFVHWSTQVGLVLRHDGALDRPELLAQ